MDNNKYDTVLRTFLHHEQAEELSEWLTNCEFPHFLEDSSKKDLSLYIGSSSQPNFTIYVENRNFEQAQKMVANFYQNMLSDVDKDYYLFEFSTIELLEILENPTDWNELDLLLAQKILKDRNVIINEIKTDDIINKRNEDRKKVVEFNWILIIIGFASSILIPGLGIAVAVIILFSKHNASNETKEYNYSFNMRLLAGAMILISVLILIYSDNKYYNNRLFEIFN